MNHLSLFWYALLYILSSFCNHLDEEERVPRRYFFCGSSICLAFAMSLCASVYMCFVVTCWERADPLALVCGV